VSHPLRRRVGEATTSKPASRKVCSSPTDASSQITVFPRRRLGGIALEHAGADPPPVLDGGGVPLLLGGVAPDQIQPGNFSAWHRH
jgi:hypothetical protein